MKTFRILAALMMAVVCVGFSSCGDEIINEVVQQTPDNTLDLLVGTWNGIGDTEGETLVFNEDSTYSYFSGDDIQSGYFEYYPNRYMLGLYYTPNYPNQLTKTVSNSQEKSLYTILKITENELVVNDDGIHSSDIIIYNRKH